MKHPWIVAVMCLLLGGGLVLARQGLVRTHDGRVIEGVVEEEAEEVTITVRGIVTTIPRENIAAIEYTGTVDEQFQRRRDALDPQDVQGRVDLARWAFEQRRYRQAADLLEEVLRINPGHREAETLLNTVRGQIRLEDARREPRPVDPEAPPVNRRPQVDRQLLTADQINVIRQVEMREPVDANIRVRFENNVQRRYVEASPMTMREFNALRPAEQTRLIMADPELRPHVRILSDPAAMAEFRRMVLPVIQSGCAASGCHGGPAGGDFILIPGDTGEQVSYTNFLILQQYTLQAETTGAVFGAPTRQYMIDRANPERSLLLQYGLPRTHAQTPHPEVPGMRAPFLSRDDRNYQIIINWIARSLNPIPPDYQLDFTPPRPAAPPEQPEEINGGQNNPQLP